MSLVLVLEEESFETLISLLSSKESRHIFSTVDLSGHREKCPTKITHDKSDDDLTFQCTVTASEQ